MALIMLKRTSLVVSADASVVSSRPPATRLTRTPDGLSKVSPPVSESVSKYEKGQGAFDGLYRSKKPGGR